MKCLIFFLMACRFADAESFTEFSLAPRVTNQANSEKENTEVGVAKGYIANFRGTCQGVMVADRWDRGLRICYKVASAQCAEVMAGTEVSLSVASKGQVRRSMPLHFLEHGAPQPVDGTVYLPSFSQNFVADRTGWNLRSLTRKERVEISPEAAANDIALIEYVCSDRPREPVQPLCRWTNQIQVGRTLFLGGTRGKQMLISGKSPFGPAVLSAEEFGADDPVASGPLFLRDGRRTCLAGFLVAAAGVGRWVATDREARGFLQELLTTLKISQEQPRSTPGSH